MTDYDTDQYGDIRPILVEYDFDTIYDDGKGPYTVERYIYRRGWDEVRNFYTKELAEAYAYRKALKHKDRYRVLGPMEEE